MTDMQAGQEFDLKVAEALGFRIWAERRGNQPYRFVVWTAPGEREPWLSSQRPETHKERYTLITAADVNFHNDIVQEFPRFSRGIRDAWRVVVRMAELGWQAQLLTPFQPGGPFFCGFMPHGVTGWNGKPDFEAGAENMPLAICLAALAALEGK